MKMASEAHTFRAARPSEAGLLSELALQSKAHWGYSAEFIAACRAELSYSEEQLRSKHMHFVVLESTGIVIAFYALARQSEKTMESDGCCPELVVIRSQAHGPDYLHAPGTILRSRTTPPFNSARAA